MELINSHKSLDSFLLAMCANCVLLCKLRFPSWRLYRLACRLQITGLPFLDPAFYVSNLETVLAHTYFLEVPLRQAQDEFFHQDSQKRQCFGFRFEAHVR